MYTQIFHNSNTFISQCALSKSWHIVIMLHVIYNVMLLIALVSNIIFISIPLPLSLLFYITLGMEMWNNLKILERNVKHKESRNASRQEDLTLSKLFTSAWNRLINPPFCPLHPVLFEWNSLIKTKKRNRQKQEGKKEGITHES